MRRRTHRSGTQQVDRRLSARDRIWREAGSRYRDRRVVQADVLGGCGSVWWIPGSRLFGPLAEADIADRCPSRSVRLQTVLPEQPNSQLRRGCKRQHNSGRWCSISDEHQQLELKACQLPVPSPSKSVSTHTLQHWRLQQVAGGHLTARAPLLGQLSAARPGG